MMTLKTPDSQISPQLVAQEPARAADARLDGPLARLQDARDLVVRLALHVAQDERRAVLFRERRDGPRHGRAALRVHQHGVLQRPPVRRVELARLAAFRLLKKSG